MRYEVALLGATDEAAKQHLLQHYRNDEHQEDLCFAIWRPSTGHGRFTALITEIIPPEPDERVLNGNASFEPHYLGRALSKAYDTQAGLAFMHSHPHDGWQWLSWPDEQAERDVIAPRTRALGVPLVGMTSGWDGTWSARFWLPKGTSHMLQWCDKTRIVTKRAYQLDFNEESMPVPPRREILRRTIDTWGMRAQGNLSRLKIGIVGLGSVGSIIAEGMARIGIFHLTLIDPDAIEIHNLDRLWFAIHDDIGKMKVDVALKCLQAHATSETFKVRTVTKKIQHTEAYRHALDCDIIFSCVDNPIPRDVLNYIANAHLIPVIDGGIAVGRGQDADELGYAHWKSQLITPNHICLRCSGQYTSNLLTMARDRSLERPSYIADLESRGLPNNENVFPFSLGAGYLAIEEMLRYVVFPASWPNTGWTEHQIKDGSSRQLDGECKPTCEFRDRATLGDRACPSDLMAEEERQFPLWHLSHRRVRAAISRFLDIVGH